MNLTRQRRDLRLLLCAAVAIGLGQMGVAFGASAPESAQSAETTARKPLTIAPNRLDGSSSRKPLNIQLTSMGETPVKPVQVALANVQAKGVSSVAIVPCRAGEQRTLSAITPQLVILVPEADPRWSTSADEASIYRTACSLAKAGKWPELAELINALGGDGRALLSADPNRKPAVPNFSFGFGGIIVPGDGGVDAAYVQTLTRRGFDCPLVVVSSFSGNWQDRYDRVFAQLQGKVKPPVIGLCPRRMALQDLAQIPAFIRRYEGRAHSVIVNNDLTNGYVDGDDTSAAYGEAVARVRLTLALVHRASPSTFTWLAVGYHNMPAWGRWMLEFEPGQYSGVMMTGGSAIYACMHPEVAEIVAKNVRAVAGNVPLGLAQFRIMELNRGIWFGDDGALDRYEKLRTALGKVGFGLVHVKEDLH